MPSRCVAVASSPWVEAKAPPETAELHYPCAIGLAVVFGGAVTAGALIAINYLRLGRRRAATFSLIAGLLTQLAIWFLVFHLVLELEPGLSLAHFLPAVVAGGVAYTLFADQRSTHPPFPAVRTVRVGWVCIALVLATIINLWGIDWPT